MNRINKHHGKESHCLVIGNDEALPPERFIRRRRVKNEMGWTVIVGSGRHRHYRHFRDDDYHGTEAALRAAVLYRDEVLPLSREATPEKRANKSEQLRIRLRKVEREAMEHRRAEDWEDGHAFAENLSTWVRHQIEPLLQPDKQPCEISREVYRQVEQLAQFLGKSPEVIIQECIDGIDNLIRLSEANRPLIVAEWRLRRSYQRERKDESENPTRG